MASADQKYLRLRGNVYWLYFRIPSRIRKIPRYSDSPELLTQSLKTSDIRIARRRRDKIVNEVLSSETEMDNHKLWLDYHNEHATVFAKHNPAEPDLYHGLETDKIIDAAIKQFGRDPETGHPLQFSEAQEASLAGLTGKEPESHSKLRYLAEQAAKEKEARGTSKATLFKIGRGVEWFLEQINKDDIAIDAITWKMVSDVLTDRLNEGVKGNTLRGYLLGLKATTTYAQRIGLVSGHSPFADHRISQEGNSYDAISWEDARRLYLAAADDLKPLIHAGATTGARISEILNGKVDTPEGYDHQCWFFCTEEGNKGKTKQSTRIVPLHDSLNYLEDGFRFIIKDAYTHRRLKKLFEEVIGDKIDKVTGKPLKIRFHSFRSSVVTELTRKHNIPLPIAGTVTGHTGGAGVGSIVTYIDRNDLEEKRKLVNLLPDITKPASTN